MKIEQEKQKEIEKKLEGWDRVVFGLDGEGGDGEIGRVVSLIRGCCSISNSDRGSCSRWQER